MMARAPSRPRSFLVKQERYRKTDEDRAANRPKREIERVPEHLMERVVVPEIPVVVETDMNFSRRNHVPANGTEVRAVDHRPIGEDAKEEDVGTDEEKEERPFFDGPARDIGKAWRFRPTGGTQWIVKRPPVVAAFYPWHRHCE